MTVAAPVQDLAGPMADDSNGSAAAANVAAAARLAHEAELVRATLGGDAGAAKELVRLFHGPVYNYVRRMVGQAQDAEDITQETMIKAFRSLDRIDTERPLINWFLTIARRTALNHFRARKDWVELSEIEASSGPGPRQEVERREQQVGIWNYARRMLNGPEFEALWLRFGEDMSTEAAAVASGRSISSIKTLIYRARQRLLAGKDSFL